MNPKRKTFIFAVLLFLVLFVLLTLINNYRADHMRLALKQSQNIS